jgi:hypothetical protein
MALTDLNSTSPAFDPARRAKKFRDSPVCHTIPRQALDRLHVLHGEAGRDLQAWQFLARSPGACIALMLAGALVLIWTAQGGASLEADFTWAILVLMSIVAITHTYIGGFARSPRRIPLKQAASRLRMLLLYAGLAWGAGALLVMPDLPGPVLVFVFATVPGLACALILRDEEGAIAFVAPASLATAGAAVLGGWPAGPWLAGAILAAGAATITLSMLQCAMRRRCFSLPDIAPR